MNFSFPFRESPKWDFKTLKYIVSVLKTILEMLSDNKNANTTNDQKPPLRGGLEGQKILVFDDPITSLDNSNLSCLVDLIAEEQKKFSQTFIFTHHRTFFKFLRKRFDKHCSEYNIIRNKKEFGGSFICKSKADKFLEKLKSFEADLKKIPPASLDVELKEVHL